MYNPNQEHRGRGYGRESKMTYKSQITFENDCTRGEGSYCIIIYYYADDVGLVHIIIDHRNKDIRYNILQIKFQKNKVSILILTRNISQSISYKFWNELI